MAKDVTFIVHGEWLTAIKDLPLEQQDAVIAELVRYGTELPARHNDDPYITAMVNLVKGKIDYSKDKYAQKVEAGKTSGTKKKYTNQMIYEAAREHLDSKSEDLAKLLGCSKSTIDHSDGWRRRYEENAVFIEE